MWEYCPMPGWLSCMEISEKDAHFLFFEIAASDISGGKGKKNQKPLIGNIFSSPSDS